MNWYKIVRWLGLVNMPYHKLCWHTDQLTVGMACTKTNPPTTISVLCRASYLDSVLGGLQSCCAIHARRRH